MKNPFLRRLGTDPIAVRDALSAGTSKAQLRARGLRTPHRGVRSAAPAATSVVTDALELAAALATAFAFSHQTAARLLALPLGRSWTPAEPLHVMTASDTHTVRRVRVTPHRGLETRQVVNVASGLPVVSAPQTWADLATCLDEDTLVILGDAVVGGWHPSHQIADLKAAIRPGARGSRRAWAALMRVRPRVMSPMESRVRLILSAAGLPEPCLNTDIVGTDGQVIACVDFVWPRQRFVLEYDGDVHRSEPGQWQRDMQRHRAIEQAGFTVARVTAADVRHGGEEVVRVVARGLGLATRFPRHGA